MDSDEIRRRRIENLAQIERQQAQSAPPADAQPKTGDAPAAGTRQEPAAPASSPGAGAAAALGASKPASAPAAAPAPAPAPARKPAAQPKPRPAERKPKVPSVAFVFGEADGEPPRDWHELNDLDIDAIIWDRLTGPKRAPNALVYLMTSHARLGSLAAALPDVARDARAVVVRFAVLSATAADDEEIYADLGKAVFQMAKTERLEPAFLQAFFAALGDDDESFAAVVAQALASLPAPVFGDPDVTTAYSALEMLLDAPGVAEAALQLPHDSPPTPTSLMSTIMMRILAPCVADGGLLKLHGPQLMIHAPLPEVMRMARDSQPVTQMLSDTQFRIVNMLVRKSPAVRRLVLDWFVAMLDANHGQTAMNRTPGKVSSFGVMINSLSVLFRLAEPFVRIDDALVMQQLAKIAPGYFANRASYDISDETKLLAAQDAPFNSRSAPEPLNFVTECFFLAVGFMHYGLSAVIQALTGSMRRHYQYFEAELAGAETNPRLVALPPPLRRIHVTRMQHMVALIKSEMAGISSQIEQPEFIRLSARFAAFTLAFAVYAAQGAPPAISIDIPWTRDPPASYAAYPELMIEAALVVESSVMRTQEFVRNPGLIENGELVVNACIFYMSSPRVLRNPYLRSKFVELLFFGGSDVPLTNGSSVPGAFSTLFSTSDTARKHLLPALMSAFIDIEHTGRTSQFYEKFNVREQIAQVFEVLWRDPYYVRQLVTESERNPEFFVQFVALLLSDATYLLDESLGKLLEVRNLQTEIETGVRPTGSTGAGSNASLNRQRQAQPQNQGPAEPDAMQVDTEGAGRDAGGAANATATATASENENENEAENENENEDDEPTDPQSRLRSAESAARSLLHFSAVSVNLLSMFTGSVPHIFSTPEILNRFAVMLNYNLAALVGPKCGELKVRDPAKLGFHPRQFLTDLVRVYLNLRNEPSFTKALAIDERSYSNANFEKAHEVLGKYNLLSPVQLDELRDLAQRTQVAWQEAQEEDEEFGDDVPDEYLDPLMFTIMENPVTLPTSKVNIDLSTIKTHLLSDQTDPFNRVPLKIEEVVPNHELKREILEYRRQKKEQKKQAA